MQHRSQARMSDFPFDPNSQYGPTPGRKPQSPVLVREHDTQGEPPAIVFKFSKALVHGVQGCCRVQSGPSLDMQSLLVPGIFPPFPLATQSL